MEYISIKAAADKWNIGVRMVQRYCDNGRIEGAIQDGCHWLIPKNASKPKRSKSGPKPKASEEINPPKLLKKLIHQRDGRNYSGLYDYSQVNLAYSSCRMASGRLTREQITLIIQKDKILTYNERINKVKHVFCSKGLT